MSLFSFKTTNSNSSTTPTVATNKMSDLDTILNEDERLLNQYGRYAKTKSALDLGLTTAQLLTNASAEPIRPLMAPRMKGYQLPNTVQEERSLLKNKLQGVRSPLMAMYRERNMDPEQARIMEMQLLDKDLQGNTEIGIRDAERIGKQNAVDADIYNKNIEIQANYDKANMEMAMQDNAKRGEINAQMMSQLGSVATGAGKSLLDVGSKKNSLNALRYIMGTNMDDQTRQALLMQFGFGDNIKYGNTAKTTVAEETKSN